MRPEANPFPLATHRFAVEPARAERLQMLLPPLLSNVSIGRAQIAIDQIRSCLADPKMGTLVLVTCVNSDETDSAVAAAIAVISPAGDPSGLAQSDTATIVHAGLTVAASQIDEAAQSAIAAGLASKIHREFASRGVTFIQWATDPPGDRDDDGVDAAAASSVHRWCANFGLEPVADLDYLSGPVVAGERSKLKFDAFDWTIGQDGLPRDWAALASLIEQTYVDTRDCPAMNRFRTAQQTMRGYVATAAMAGQFWFTARESDASEDDSVGVLILGVHGSSQASDADPPPVVEIIYMGLVPDARGRGLGRSLVHQAMSAARTIGAERLILAVDRNNVPAANHYQAVGLEPMLCEQVWCGEVKTKP